MSRAVWYWDHMVPLLFTYFHNMFIAVSPRTSDAVERLAVSPLRGIARVQYTNGGCYEYTNVSRRAIMNLLFNDNISLGFWVNTNCALNDRPLYRQMTVFETV